MALTPLQKEYINQLDELASRILQEGGEEALLKSLANQLIKIKELLDSVTNDELNTYCVKYKGFYQYMQLLDQFTTATASGALAVRKDVAS